uniref:Uncharacterized protein n=1 Tax=Kalanchoe fedtschenkoi TaxID=63787 RepID=A0A7N0RBP5_KALFE
MASTYSSATLPFRRTNSSTAGKAHCTKPSIPSLPYRRHFLFLTSGAAATFATGQLTAKAEDIGLFGIRKKIKEVEKEAEEIVEKGVEAAEKGLEAAEEEIESTTTGFGPFAQAGAVAAAEVLGVLVATSIVNGILGPEAQKS